MKHKSYSIRYRLLAAAYLVVSLWQTPLASAADHSLSARREIWHWYSLVAFPKCMNNKAYWANVFTMFFVVNRLNSLV